MQLQSKISILALALAIAACGGGGDDDKKDDDSGSEQAAQQVGEQQVVVEQPGSQQQGGAPAQPPGPPSLEEALAVVEQSFDLNAPSPGNTGTLSVASILADRVTVTWQAASDNETAAADLKYMVYLSSANNLTNLANTESNGDPQTGFTKNKTSHTLTGLEQGSTYYVNVVVKDEASNTTAYKSRAFTTSFRPVPPSDTSLTIAHEGADIRINWQAASNGGSETGDLQYRIYQSNGAPISTLEDLLANATPLTGNMASTTTFLQSDPGPSVRRSYNILVTDGNGDQIVYTPEVFASDAYVYITYTDNTNRDLKHARYVQTQWQPLEVIDGASDDIYQFMSSSVLDSSGHLHIAYYKTTGADLYYATDSSGSFETELAFSSGSVGQYPAIGIQSNGEPVIAAYDASDRDLVVYLPFSGAWAGVPAYADPNFVGQWAEMKVDANGALHLSSYDQNATELVYTTNASGSWVSTSVDGTDAVGQYSGIALDGDGHPHISYYDATNTALKYAQFDGTTWNIETVDNTASSGTWSTIEMLSSGRAVIAYYDATARDLVLATQQGDGSWLTEIVAGQTSQAGGNGIGLAVDRLDRIHISYHDTTGTKLMYAYLAEEGGSWQLTEVDNDAVNAVGRESSIAVR